MILNDIKRAMVCLLKYIEKNLHGRVRLSKVQYNWFRLNIETINKYIVLQKKLISESICINLVYSTCPLCQV